MKKFVSVVNLTGEDSLTPEAIKLVSDSLTPKTEAQDTELLGIDAGDVRGDIVAYLRYKTEVHMRDVLRATSKKSALDSMSRAEECNLLANEIEDAMIVPGIAGNNTATEIN
jgi:hypothetical protein